MSRTEAPSSFDESNILDIGGARNSVPPSPSISSGGSDAESPWLDSDSDTYSGNAAKEVPLRAVSPASSQKVAELRMMQKFVKPLTMFRTSAGDTVPIKLSNILSNDGYRDRDVLCNRVASWGKSMLSDYWTARITLPKAPLHSYDQRLVCDFTPENIYCGSDAVYLDSECCTTGHISVRKVVQLADLICSLVPSVELPGTPWIKLRDGLDEEKLTNLMKCSEVRATTVLGNECVQYLKEKLRVPQTRSDYLMNRGGGSVSLKRLPPTEEPQEPQELFTDQAVVPVDKRRTLPPLITTTPVIAAGEGVDKYNAKNRKVDAKRNTAFRQRPDQRPTPRRPTDQRPTPRTPTNQRPTPRRPTVHNPQPTVHKRKLGPGGLIDRAAVDPSEYSDSESDDSYETFKRSRNAAPTAPAQTRVAPHATGVSSGWISKGTSTANAAGSPFQKHVVKQRKLGAQKDRQFQQTLAAKNLDQQNANGAPPPNPAAATYFHTTGTPGIERKFSSSDEGPTGTPEIQRKTVLSNKNPTGAREGKPVKWSDSD